MGNNLHQQHVLLSSYICDVGFNAPQRWLKQGTDQQFAMKQLHKQQDLGNISKLEA